MTNTTEEALWPDGGTVEDEASPLHGWRFERSTMPEGGRPCWYGYPPEGFPAPEGKTKLCSYTEDPLRVLPRGAPTAAIRRWSCLLDWMSLSRVCDAAEDAVNANAAAWLAL